MAIKYYKYLEEKKERDKKNMTLYKITITTSSFATAGTNYNVGIQIFGSNKDMSMKAQNKNKNLRSSFAKKFSYLTTSITFPLEKSLTNQKKFRPGQKDKFEIEETRLEKIKKIRLFLIDNPLKTNWHIKRVVIKADEKRWLFMHRSWLRYSEFTKHVECTLVPLKDDQEKNLKVSEEEDTGKPELVNKIRYDIKIKTSRCSQLFESNQNINLKIVGKDGGETKIVKLNKNLSDEEKEKFQAGFTDVFYFEEYDVGNVSL